MRWGCRTSRRETRGQTQGGGERERERGRLPALYWLFGASDVITNHASNVSQKDTEHTLKNYSFNPQIFAFFSFLKKK